MNDNTEQLEEKEPVEEVILDAKPSKLAEGRYFHKGMILDANSEEEALTKYQAAEDFVEDPDFAEEMRLEAEATQYQRDRKYPPIGDQLDALFHAGAFPQEMADKIQATKDAHPKT